MSTTVDTDQDDATEVRNVVAMLDDAFNRRDVDAIMSFYDATALMVVQPGRVVRGNAALREAFTALVNQGSRVEVLSSEVLAVGATALFIARWSIRRAADSDDEVHVATSVLQRAHDGKWRLVIDNAFGPAVLADAHCRPSLLKA